MHQVKTLLSALALGACSNAGLDAAPSPDEPIPAPAQLIELASFESAFVKARQISVWLPPDYDANRPTGYPVIYAHDGQNLFEPRFSYGGVEWGLDETASRLMATGELRPAVIVGIWNTDQRWQEYAPQKVIESLTGDTASDWLGPTLPDLQGDAYLRFMTKELKPFIDRTYRTNPDRSHTFVMGSSMGGLISLYAMAEHPDTFSRAAAVSVHWPLAEPDGAIARQADTAMTTYLATSDLDRATQTLWFDRGTETMDAAYAPHAAAMEAWFRDHGWTQDEAVFKAYPGTDHSEAAWAERADEILTFLLTYDQSED